MKKITILIAAIMLSISVLVDAQARFISRSGHINFFSTTPAEDITADNFNVTSTMNTETGEVMFSVPMQSFEFEKSLMQRHFNQRKFLHTKEYPHARFQGRIINLDEIDFDTNGVYDADIEGQMTIRGETQEIKEPGTVTVDGNKVTAKSKFNVRLEDYGITFSGGKPASNIADVVEVTVNTEYLVDDN